MLFAAYKSNWLQSIDEATLMIGHDQEIPERDNQEARDCSVACPFSQNHLGWLLCPYQNGTAKFY